MFVASARTSNWWSSLPRSAWYQYHRPGEANLPRTCATQAASFYRRLLSAIGQLAPNATTSRAWTQADTAALASAVLAAGVPSYDGQPATSLSWQNSTAWTRDMLRDALWFLNHRGEIDPFAIVLPADTILPRYNQSPPVDASRPTAVSGPQCADGMPEDQPSSVVPGASTSAVAVAMVFGLTAGILGGAWLLSRRTR
jgi:hypothetical protein